MHNILKFINNILNSHTWHFKFLDFKTYRHHFKIYHNIRKFTYINLNLYIQYFQIHMQYFQIYIHHFKIYIQHFKIHIQFLKIHKHIKIHIEHFKLIHSLLKELKIHILNVVTQHFEGLLLSVNNL